MQAEAGQMSLTSRPQVEPPLHGSNGARPQGFNGSRIPALNYPEEESAAASEAPSPSQQPSLASLFRDPVPTPRAGENLTSAAAQPAPENEAGDGAPVATRFISHAETPSLDAAANVAPVLPQAPTSAINVSTSPPADVPGNGHDIINFAAPTHTSTSPPAAVASGSAIQPSGRADGASTPSPSSAAEAETARLPVREQPRPAALPAARGSSPPHGSPADAIAEAIKAAAAATGSGA